MQTALADFIRDTGTGREADRILRACVHCGFCNATCPTYQLLGDELDGPRGRIYLMKQVLEGQAPTAKTQLHLDRCLTCRNCEVTCPSGVQYGRLLDIGRDLVERQVARGWFDRLRRQVLRAVIAYPARFTPLVRLGQLLRPLAPAPLRRAIPAARAVGAWPAPRHARRMLVLEGCAQPGVAPNINAAAARVLDRLGISLIVSKGAGCCGALSHHTSAAEEGLDFARRNINAWWPHIEAGAEAIVMTASGCGVHVKEYGRLLAHDPTYAAKAARVAAATRDLSEIIAGEDVAALHVSAHHGKLAFHAPCSLQHGQRLSGVVENLLRRLGFVLTPVPDAHLCCGSAGTYSILHPTIARELRDNKVRALESGGPVLIATANVGCLAHIQAGTDNPVRHWIEVVDEALSS
jgi:glycolate oxidase iron-sulfur subunit